MDSLPIREKGVVRAAAGNPLLESVSSQVVDNMPALWKKTDTAVAVFVSVFRSRIRILPIVRVYYLLPDSAAAVSKVSQKMDQPVLEYSSTVTF